jgi:YaiO family outer membrane protein
MISKKMSLIILVLAIPSQAWAAQNIDIQQQTQRKPEIQEITSQDKKILVSAYNDYGWVKQGAEKGQWALTTATVGFTGHPSFSPYFEIDLWDRLGIHDYTANAGSYFKFKDNSFLNAEIGFGGDVNYLYRFKSQLEYQHKLIQTLFWSLGGRYLNYPSNDTYIIYPGLIFYFGNNDISIYYNHSVTESRGQASSGIIRGNFVINNRLSLYAGAAAGERLFDIFELPASEQFGYIGFGGLNFRLTGWLTARTGFSYSTEKPSFIKRSLEFGLTAKF